MRRTTTLGCLRVGNTFYLDGIRYRVGHLIDGTNGYVACVNTETKRVTRLYIDTAVKVQKGE